VSIASKCKLTDNVGFKFLVIQERSKNREGLPAWAPFHRPRPGWCTCTPLALAYEISGEGIEKKISKKIM